MLHDFGQSVRRRCFVSNGRVMSRRGPVCGIGTFMRSSWAGRLLGGLRKLAHELYPDGFIYLGGFISNGIFMKRAAFFLLLGCVLQISFEARAAAQPSARKTNDPASLVAPTIIARTPSSRVWARIISTTNSAGEVSVVTNHAYTELGGGLCV